MPLAYVIMFLIIIRYREVDKKHCNAIIYITEVKYYVEFYVTCSSKPTKLQELAFLCVCMILVQRLLIKPLPSQEAQIVPPERGLMENMRQHTLNYTIRNTAHTPRKMKYFHLRILTVKSSVRTTNMQSTRYCKKRS